MDQQAWRLTVFSSALDQALLSLLSDALVAQGGILSALSLFSAEVAYIFFKAQVKDPKDFLKKIERVSEHGFVLDLVLQEETSAKRDYKFAVFDMDSTLIKAEVIDELAKCAGVGEQVARVTEAAMRGELDFNQSLEKRLSLIAGLSSDVLEGIAQNLPIMDGLEALMLGLKERGIKTAILSGGFTYFALELQRRFAFDYIRANELEISEQRLTGRLLSEIVNAERKKYFLQELCRQEQIPLSQSIAVGDGANDLAMISCAGLGIAFHAKPIVREQAPHRISSQGLDAILALL